MEIPQEAIDAASDAIKEIDGTPLTDKEKWVMSIGLKAALSQIGSRPAIAPYIANNQGNA